MTIPSSFASVSSKLTTLLLFTNTMSRSPFAWSPVSKQHLSLWFRGQAVNLTQVSKIEDVADWKFLLLRMMKLQLSGLKFWVCRVEPTWHAEITRGHRAERDKRCSIFPSPSPFLRCCARQQKEDARRESSRKTWYSRGRSGVSVFPLLLMPTISITLFSQQRCLGSTLLANSHVQRIIKINFILLSGKQNPDRPDGNGAESRL